MINKTLLLFVLALSVLVVNGQSKLSPHTQSYLLNYKTTIADKEQEDVKKSIYTKSITIDNKEFIDVFVEMNEGASIDSLVDMGAILSTKMGDIVTAQIPIDKIIAISELEVVKQISMSKPVVLHNDKERTATKVTSVHQGVGLYKPFTGKDVVVGVVDMGIDVNHIAFTDQDGNSRVKRVYFPSISGGSRPTGTGVNGGAYTGSEYKTTTEIAALTTDTRTESHGTHTSCTAAGGYKGNDFYGNAPEADLVLVGSNRISDVVVANGVAYTFAYAKSVGKPAVVNLSLGSNFGPHDGSSTIAKYLNALENEGNIIVISSGNEGEDNLYITKNFTEPNGELKSFLKDNNYGSLYHNGFADAWGRTNMPIGVKIVVYSNTGKNIVYESDVYNPGAKGGSAQLNSSNDSEFAKYYKGTVTIISGVNGSNNKYNTYCELNVKVPNFNTSSSQPNYKLGIVYTTGQGGVVDVWADNVNTCFSGELVAGWTTGTPESSINDWATGNNTISVGAYCTKEKFKALDGGSYSMNGTVMNEIAPFSSYGIDGNGISRPEVTAPGFFLESAVNSYDQATVVTNRSMLSREITLGGRKHQWGTMAGTSMSSPAVAGIIALWLQADPTLSIDDVKSIIRTTSIKDAYVLRGNPVGWGAGKIDANAGLIEVLKLSSVSGAVKENNAIILYPNPSNGQFKVFAQGETGNITLNVYSSNGALVATQVFDAGQGEANIDLSGELSSGLYIVQLIGVNVNHTSRLIIK